MPFFMVRPAGRSGLWVLEDQQPLALNLESDILLQRMGKPVASLRAEFQPKLWRSD